MSLLHPQPPPPHTTAWKLPYTSLRKQLRLLLEEVPNEETHPSDISYVYSGYAPLSIRLVQCIAQMNGVLASFGGSLAAGGADEGDSGKKGAKVNAHPIVGWKGFEDVVTTIPGKTVDVTQQAADGAIAAAPSCMCSILSRLSELMRLHNLSSQQYYRRRRALRLSFSFWVAVPTQKSPLYDGWENICEVRWSIVTSKENNRTRIRTKVRDCYDWHRERKLFNRCVNTGELHEGASTILIGNMLLLLSCKILDIG